MTARRTYPDEPPLATLAAATAGPFVGAPY